MARSVRSSGTSSDTESIGQAAGRVQFDPRVCGHCFGRKPFMVSHRLIDDPRFQLPGLVELAGRLPESSIEYNAGDIPICVDTERTPSNGLSAEETIRRIHECRSWMVMKNVEQIPVYKELLEECLAEVAAASDGAVPRMYNQQGFIFISSPGAVTPYHMDPEHNFLLQLKGIKTMSVFDPSDRSLLSEQELERFFSGAHRNLSFRERYQQCAQVFRLTPGTGLHIPVTAPHWVRNGDDVSISFSITFRSAHSERREKLYRVNALLRHLGWKPAGPGRSIWADTVKLGGFELLRRSKQLISRVARAGPKAASLPPDG